MPESVAQAFPCCKVHACCPKDTNGERWSTKCEDNPRFRDQYGTCTVYSSKGWCANGETGPRPGSQCIMPTSVQEGYLQMSTKRAHTRNALDLQNLHCVFIFHEGLRLPSLVVPGPGWLASWGKLSATAQASCCACGKEMQIGPIIRVTANGDAPMALAVQKSDLSMQHMNRLLDVYTTNAPNPKPTISVQLTPGV